MDAGSIVLFVLLLTGAIYAFSELLQVPLPGAGGDAKKRLQRRLEDLDTEEARELPIELLRERFRRKPSPLEHVLGRIPKLRDLARSLELPGQKISGYAYLLMAFVLCVAGALTGWFFAENLLAPMVAGAALGSAPFLKIRSERNHRFNLFEEQLVAALDIMIRALRAGYPFPETLRQVSRELDDPIATEFQTVFDQINGGIDVRTALRNMVGRIPSLSLMAVVTTVLLQRETGGNLSESLSNIGDLIRGRFKFQRHLKTLTAEGRISAWVLGLIPFLIFLIQLFISPEVTLNFIKEPEGQHMLYVGFGFITAGVLWIRKLLDLQI